MIAIRGKDKIKLDCGYSVILKHVTSKSTCDCGKHFYWKDSGALVVMKDKTTEFLEGAFQLNNINGNL